MPCFGCFGASPVEDADFNAGPGTPLKSLSPPDLLRGPLRVVPSANSGSGLNPGGSNDRPGSFHGSSAAANPTTSSHLRNPSGQNHSHLNQATSAASGRFQHHTSDHDPSTPMAGLPAPRTPLASGLYTPPLSPGRAGGISGLAGAPKAGSSSKPSGNRLQDPSQRDSDHPTKSSKDSSSRPEGHVKRKTIKSNPPEGQEWRDWRDNPACDHYDFVKVLGGGAYAEVILGVHKTTKKQHALKVVYLKNPTLKESHITVLQREGTYLQTLQHKNIVKCHKVYKATTHWVFVLEYLKGGMLLNDLSKLKRYSEKTAAAVFRQILHAVNYLHERKIVHRDIKPDNVVFKTTIRNSSDFGKDNVVKLVDFGMLLDLSKEPQMKGIMGSPGYVAPEVGMGHYHSTQMDCYSLGVMLFVMLVGSKPMSQDQVQGMKYAWMQPEQLRNMHEPQWKMLSDPARDLVLQLLQPDPERRATVKLALNHRWIKGAREDSILDGSVMEGWADPGHVMPPPWMASRLHSNLKYAPWAAAAAGMPVPPPGHSGMPMSPQTGAHHPFQAGPGHSYRIPGAPISPVGVAGTTVFTQGHGHTQQMHGHTRRPGGTPTGEMSGRSGPFGHAQTWAAPQTSDMMSTGLSAPLQQYGQGQGMNMRHDELMRKAHEKLIESDNAFKAARAILTRGGISDGHSGLTMGAPQTSGHGASFGHPLVPVSPHASSKRLSGHLMPEGSYEQSLFAQGHSTNACSGSIGNHSGMPPGSSQHRQGAASRSSDALRESQNVDNELKDANKLIAELDSAPSSPPRRDKSSPGLATPPTSVAGPSHHTQQNFEQLSNPVSSIHSDLFNPGGDMRMSGRGRPNNMGGSMGGGQLRPGNMGGGSYGMGGRTGKMGGSYGMGGRSGNMGGSMGGGSMGGGGIPGHGMHAPQHAARSTQSSQRQGGPPQQGVIRNAGRQNLSQSMGGGGRGGAGAVANMSGSMGGGYGRTQQGSMGAGRSRASSSSHTKHGGEPGRGSGSSVRSARGAVRTPGHSRIQSPAILSPANKDPDDPNAYDCAPPQPTAPMSNTKSIGGGTTRKPVRSSIDTGQRVGAGSMGTGARRPRTSSRP